jgi:hypothetical protein
MVYANGAPLAQSAQGTVFFHDFQPGTYRLTVQPFGTPANVVDTVQLAHRIHDEGEFGVAEVA